MGLALERLKREDAAFSRRTAGNGALERRAFVCYRVPFAAGIAAPLPAAVNGAAVLANERGCVLGHGRLGRDGGWDQGYSGVVRTIQEQIGGEPLMRGTPADIAGRDWSTPRNRWCRRGPRDRRRRIHRRAM